MISNSWITTFKKSLIKNHENPEKGASLVELLVAMAISVLVFSILSTALVQFVLTTRWGNSLLQVTNDIQVTTIWLGRDALESASFSPGSGSEYGTLSWADSSTQYRYSYDSASGALVREHIENGTVLSSQKVARHINNQTDVTFNASGHLLTVGIISTSGSETKSATLVFALRTR